MLDTDDEYADEQFDDELYDVGREEDQGEPEDMANDELECRFAEYEEQVDIAALQGLEITSKDGEPQGNIGNASSCTVRKGRGPTKGLKKSNGPMHVEFDSLKRPCGPFRHQYGQNIGFCMRKLNINWEWKSVSLGMKEALWKDTMVNILIYLVCNK